jgi:hypothetical protein
MRVASSPSVLVIDGWRVLLKLCFQVFIVLSPADEAGTCRVYEDAWGGAAVVVSRVRVSGRRPWFIAMLDLARCCRARIVW